LAQGKNNLNFTLCYSIFKLALYDKMQPISNDIRERIIIHKQNGVAEKEIAKWLVISQSSVTKIWAAFKNSGSFLPKARTQGRKKAFSDDVLAKVLDKIEE
jgi:transposase